MFFALNRNRHHHFLSYKKLRHGTRARSLEYRLYQFRFRRLFLLKLKAGMTHTKRLSNRQTAKTRNATS